MLTICEAQGRPPLLCFLDGLDPKLRHKLGMEFWLLASAPTGLLTEPHVKHFTLERYQRLYELRARNGVMVRVIYTPLDGDKLLLLHPFVKRRDRDTKRALEEALKLLAEVESGKRSIMELPIQELEGVMT